MSEKLLETDLYEWHVKSGAKMAPFAGFSMPIHYPAGALKEIAVVRNKAGLFDISHMGQIFVTGNDAREFLNFISVRDISPLKEGQARYTLACDHEGRPLDDLIIYRLPDKKNKFGEEKFMVVSNASNVRRIHKWLLGVRKGYKDYQVLRETLSVSFEPEKYSFFALQGPLSEIILQYLVEFDELPNRNYTCEYLQIDAAPCIVLRSGYTGEDGFEILVPSVHSETVWELILDIGMDYGALPCGLASRDTLRLEAGMPLFGHEVDAEHDPISAGLGRYVNFTDAKGEPRKFIGRDALKKIADGEVKKPKLYAFTMEKGRIPRAGCRIMNISGPIGVLTSAGPSPTLGKNIALGYIEPLYEVTIGQTVDVEIGGKLYPATVVNRPFYRREKK